MLLDLLGQDRRHRLGATIKTIMVFWISRSTVHHIVHRVTYDVVAIRSKVTMSEEELDNVSAGFAGLTSLRASHKAMGAINSSNVCIQAPGRSTGSICDHQDRGIVLCNSLNRGISHSVSYLLLFIEVLLVKCIIIVLIVYLELF